MFRTLLSAAFLLALLTPAIVHAQGNGAPSPFGLWLTENERSVIDVRPCKTDSTKVCGKIHWIIDGGMQHDSKNPDASKQGNPMCGLMIMHGFHQNDAMNWIDGEIYKADEGDTYNASLQMLPSGKMLVRGYVGMPLFGKSQAWTRVTGTEHPKCKPAKPL